MTKTNLLFASTSRREYWVEFDDPELLVLAELIADSSTLKDKNDFFNRYPGAWDVEDDYAHQLSATEQRVLTFAQTHNLPVEEIEL